ncbi:MAG TPA: nitrilase-related carbon-nitrogen hydrolase, partial [Dongiaceae bacterium]
MDRRLTLAVGQLGPIARDEPRAAVVRRLIALLETAKARGAALVVFPEMALTTFFPRWHITEEAELESFFEHEMPNEATAPLFETAARLGIGFYLGYCELIEVGNRKRRFNTSILVDGVGRIIGKYRKIHVPGSDVNIPDLPFQHLEQMYF